MMRTIALFCFTLVSLSLFGQQEILDYRRFQTPVKNQVNRGTCTAFAVAAALETLPGVPADISEQYLYGALKHSQPGKKYQEGDRLLNYTGSLQQYGFIHEEFLPYNPDALDWEASDSEFVRVIQGAQIGKVGMFLMKYYAKYFVQPAKGMRYYPKDAASNPEIIKKLLNEGNLAIPVTYNLVHIPTWEKECGTFKKPWEPSDLLFIKAGERIYNYSVAKFFYKGDLPKAIKEGKFGIQLRDLNMDNYGGHAVTIVGYNNKGFIFKNSWGKDWGDSGYGFISFDLHELLVEEAVVFDEVSFAPPSSEKKQKLIRDVRLKTTRMGKNMKGLHISLFTNDYFADQNYTKVTYNVYSNGKLLDQKVITPPQYGNYDCRYGVTIFDDKVLVPWDILTGDNFLTVDALVEGEGPLNSLIYRFEPVYWKTAEIKSAN